MSEDAEERKKRKKTGKKTEPFLLSNAFNASVVYNMEGLENFCTTIWYSLKFFLSNFETFCPKIYCKTT